MALTLTRLLVPTRACGLLAMALTLTGLFPTRACGLLATALTLTGPFPGYTGLWETEPRMWTESAQLVWSVRLAANTIFVSGASAV